VTSVYTSGLPDGFTPENGSHVQGTGTAPGSSGIPCRRTPASGLDAFGSGQQESKRENDED